jgi:hypothetical protein
MTNLAQSCKTRKDQALCGLMRFLSIINGIVKGSLKGPLAGKTSHERYPERKLY